MPSVPDPNCVPTTVEKSHGRIEKRTLETTRILTVHERWKGLKQGFRLTRERTVKGVKMVEVVYGITSLSGERANAAKLLEIVRRHWDIENRLHDVRDVTLGEDASRVRKGSDPQVLAALRNAMIHLWSGLNVSSVPEAIEQMQIRPEDAKRLSGFRRVNKGMALGRPPERYLRP